MPAAFWLALDRLGALGAAACDWRRMLGHDFEHARRLLRELPGPAGTVTHPLDGSLRLAVEPLGAGGFVAVLDDWQPTGEALRFDADDVVRLAPDWAAIAAALGDSLGFTPNRYESTGLTRQIGTAHGAGDPARPVVLCLPGGHFGDHGRMLADLAARRDASILLTHARWLTPQIQAVAAANGLTLRDLHAEFAAGAVAPPDLAAPHVPRGSGTRVKPLFSIRPGWSWEMVVIEVAASGRVVFRCDGQTKDYHFPKSKQKTFADGYEILMGLAANPEWRNPPSGAADHEVLRKRFRRLSARLEGLLRLPGKPFVIENGAFRPVFQIAFHPSLASSIQALGLDDEEDENAEWRRLELEEYRRGR